MFRRLLVATLLVLCCRADWKSDYETAVQLLNDRSYRESIPYLQRCIQAHPMVPSFHSNMALALDEIGESEGSLRSYVNSLRLQPDDSQTFNNLGVLLKRQGRILQAKQSLEHSIHLNADMGPAYFNLGDILLGLRDYVGAARMYKKSAEVEESPDANSFSNLALAFLGMRDFRQSIVASRMSLAIRPGDGRVTAKLCYLLRSVCDWSGWEDTFASLKALALAHPMQDNDPTLDDLDASYYQFSGRQLKVFALAHASKYISKLATLHADQFVISPTVIANRHLSQAAGSGQRLTIGYMSPYFRAHGVGTTLQNLLGRHDRRRVQSIGFSLAPGDGSLQSLKFRKEVEVFVDIASLSFRAAAHVIQQYSPVVLIDVNGYMEGSQPELFALQLAPIQLSFQGVPLTTGAPYMQYRISDTFVAPPQMADSWTEHMVYMPHSYHVSQHSVDQDRNGSVIPMIDRLPASERGKYGLPSDVVLFGTFNNLVKVDPSTFAVWSNILRRVPASALWTAKFPPEAEPNLRAQAAAYGLHPQRRLIFTDRHPQPVHVQIKSLCDLYLDSPHHNAHATAVDVLWAGVPMLTQPMETLPSRVATSLSRAAGMEDATTALSVKQYEDLAVRLASDPDGELAAIRKTLEGGRASTPAFNMATFIRNYEAALFSMWDVYSAGEDVLHHSVEDRSQRSQCSYNMCM